jgi:hypothetical protein
LCDDTLDTTVREVAVLHGDIAFTYISSSELVLSEDEVIRSQYIRESKGKQNIVTGSPELSTHKVPNLLGPAAQLLTMPFNLSRRTGMHTSMPSLLQPILWRTRSWKQFLGLSINWPFLMEAEVHCRIHKSNFARPYPEPVTYSPLMRTLFIQN